MTASRKNIDRSEHSRGDASRVLIVAGDVGRRSWMNKALRQGELECSTIESAADALMMMAKYQGGEEANFDAVVIDAPVCTPATLKLIKVLGQRRVPALIVFEHVSFDEAVQVMKAGAADILGSDIKAKDLTKRVREAVGRSRTRTPVDEGRTPMSAKTNDDFHRLIENELDVETLLRHALEYVLGKLGPTNAAIFLPGSTGEYALGAYVNLSCSKDTAEVMLDQLANIAAPRLESTVRIVDIGGAAKLRDMIGEAAEWIDQGGTGSQRVLAFACRQESECLAVFMLFREKSQPFPAETHAILSMIRDEFGKQLARVIRIHHRHLPRDQWGALGDGWESGSDRPPTSNDSDDLAA